ncbi:2-oxoglutarate dehydrogenase complex dihydrolipoyllysine-residue succinyltransferase [Deinococcus aquiradiocola]|uniref:Dihydrolipoyllysine-residue succinyltransferase component of 2-oxoglutarate dehydrogenase complex n=1 Tax=Deinococcus aquiradiocola TaxID=393059 RepID=A0A917PPM5_9DEIO|nr:2-oxoglutarate dehydrogenase complex dihydrolipoyllysine-residue succinyltransferase [Deinococcus aquiradiocola]GGJ87371.1 dihydrolipoyllysine-residue succinyltransferase component of 2-oxoglutarate dehydrogenase complex [Deinococcus aquiradiocola]
MPNINVPVFSESVSEGTLLSWNKKPGDSVKRGEVLAEIETDKVVLEVTALQDGVLSSVSAQEGDTVLSEQVIGVLGEAGAAAPAAPAAAQDAAAGPVAGESTAGGTAAQPDSSSQSAQAQQSSGNAPALSPAVRKVVAENNLDASQIPATGPKGNITKQDAVTAASAPAAPQAPASTPAAAPAAPVQSGPRAEQRVPMTRIRQRIAERLKDVQNTAAILTTFNEVNMKPAMDLRKKYQDLFVAKHGVKLGFMSLFVRAATEALKAFPAVNASIDGKDIVYHGFYDMGIAVASERGLVVPILRDTDQLSLADIEKAISGFAQKAKAGKLTMEDMSGGTFSITNGGTFGSMMSTPIINAPQSAILGMHNIIERPIAQNGQVVIAPMMYLALSYDHRIIDGKEAVQFLVTIKNYLEDPARILLDL